MKQKIKKELKQLQDKKYQEFHQGLCPGTTDIIGIRVPILRNYAKELLKKYTLEEIIENLDNQYYEEILLEGILIGLSKEDYETTIKYIEKFVPKINNWAVCDTFCAGLKITKKHKEEMFEFLQKYLKSSKEFEIRFGIVMLLDYYVEEQYLDKLFKIFNSIKNTEYYVQMAVAWAISICLIKYYDKTCKYLENAILDDFTYNKAIQKAIESYRIPDEKKTFLRKMKR